MSETTSNLIANSIPQALKTETEAHPVLKGMARLSLVKQLGLMLGLAFSVALGVAVVLWSQKPSYGRLLADLTEKDVADISQILETEGIPYQVEAGSGAILVPRDRVSEIRLKLAGQGLPHATGVGYELLDKEQAFGASKSTEMVRFQRALEGEIAKTIMSIQHVKSAKVLLALPAQSVFIRERKKPSASVVVNLYQGRTLDKNQIESIVHLVASSVPQLEADHVTVVDQRGQLLSGNNSDADVNLTSRQFEYKKNIEEHLMRRIENILAPLVGADGMRTQISADVDFTVTDKTQEMFNPDLPALRSEQTSEEHNTLAAAQGVPGALSNQPTAAGAAPETAASANGAAGQSQPAGSATRNATRNFELDKTITHTRLATGMLRRLSVAVVVDDKHVSQADGHPKHQSHSPEDIGRFTELVKQAVGFDSGRGDQVTVTNVAFKTPEALETVPSDPFWRQGWFLDALKQLAAVLVVLFLLMGVLRPALRLLGGPSEDEIRASLLAQEEAKKTAAFDENGIPVAVPAGGHNAPSLAAPDMLLLDMPQSYEHRLEYVKRLVDDDPKVVAQVIKTWIK